VTPLMFKSFWVDVIYLFIYFLAVRYEWIHSKASTERFEEEVLLLEAESLRVVATFAHLKNQWKKRGESEVTDHTDKGRVAYAKRCAATFAKLEILSAKRQAELQAIKTRFEYS
jgi:hypothetical protein